MSQLDGVSIQEPTEAQGYRVAAEAMLAGARPLVSVVPLPSVALTLLCGHGTEAALKALLAKAGITSDDLRRPYRHDLLALWERALALGAKLPLPRPQWVDHLHRVHASPHHLRYPLGFHGLALPNQQAMFSGFEQLVLAVNEVVN